jgi:hypothetical protein
MTTKPKTNVLALVPATSAELISRPSQAGSDLLALNHGGNQPREIALTLALGQQQALAMQLKHLKTLAAQQMGREIQARTAEGVAETLTFIHDTFRSHGRGVEPILQQRLDQAAEYLSQLVLAQQASLMEIGVSGLAELAHRPTDPPPETPKRWWEHLFGV